MVLIELQCEELLGLMVGLDKEGTGEPRELAVIKELIAKNAMRIMKLPLSKLYLYAYTQPRYSQLAEFLPSALMLDYHNKQQQALILNDLFA